VDEALKRLPQDVLDARNQRLRRASDLSLKHSELPKELQQLQTPFELYVKDTLDVSGSSSGRDITDSSSSSEVWFDSRQDRHTTSAAHVDGKNILCTSHGHARHHMDKFRGRDGRPW
jgi:hypothetical protein